MKAYILQPLIFVFATFYCILASAQAQFTPYDELPGICKSYKPAYSEDLPDWATNSDWTFLGPKETFWLNESVSPTDPSSCPWQANIYSFDEAASNNNIIYCGTERGFYFVTLTDNQGVTYRVKVVKK